MERSKNSDLILYSRLKFNFWLDDEKAKKASGEKTTIERRQNSDAKAWGSPNYKIAKDKWRRKRREREEWIVRATLIMKSQKMSGDEKTRDNNDPGLEFQFLIG